MKKIILTIIVLTFACNLFAQKDSTFYKNEIRVSLGDAFMESMFLPSAWNSDRGNEGFLYVNLSFSYFYRPLKWLWIGGNFINYFGEKIDYTWKEQYADGSVKDFEKSKTKYYAVIAPEIRFSYLNRKNVILYSSLSGGVGFENGYTRRYYTYPQISYYFNLTYFGFSYNFGKNKNIFVGGELCLGLKGIFNIHGGYRF